MEMQGREHIGWIDLLRVLACFLVVFSHCCDPFVAVFDSDRPTFLYGCFSGSLVRCCVPLFVMMTGVLLLPVRTDTAVFYRKRIGRILLALIFWSVALPLLYLLYTRIAPETSLDAGNYTWEATLPKLWNFIFNFTYETTPLWYLYMLAGLYLVMPVLSAWLERASRRDLRILLGSRPLKDDEGADRVKFAILMLLNEKYGLTEEDFLSAELTMVPAGPAREVGFDRSLIAAYGHDDRVCAYAAFKPLLDLGTPVKTAVCVLADKEEIGSVGISGMQSQYFEMFMEDLCEATGASKRRCFEHSFCLSADVSNAFDPLYAETCDPANNTKINYGTGIFKYTGARGKSGSSDAAAEVMGYVRRIFAKHDVIWQTGELGKVDQGGGGTVACYMANRNIETVDAGVPVLSMHAPMEIVSKLDTYMTFKGMKVFYEEN